MLELKTYPISLISYRIGIMNNVFMQYMCDKSPFLLIWHNFHQNTIILKGLKSAGLGRATSGAKAPMKCRREWRRQWPQKS